LFCAVDLSNGGLGRGGSSNSSNSRLGSRDGGNDRDRLNGAARGHDAVGRRERDGLAGACCTSTGDDGCDAVRADRDRDVLVRNRAGRCRLHAGCGGGCRSRTADKVSRVASRPGSAVAVGLASHSDRCRGAWWRGGAQADKVRRITRGTRAAVGVGRTTSLSKGRSRKECRKNEAFHFL